MNIKIKADLIITHPEMAKLSEQQKAVLALEAEQHINSKCQAFMSTAFGGKDVVGLRIHGKGFGPCLDEIDERIKLKAIAIQLEKWAEESISGGWSTHQVRPMREKAKDIFTLLGKKY